MFNLSRMGALVVMAVFCPLLSASAGGKDFRFAWLSDTHIGVPNADDDLRLSVKDINSFSDLSFVIVSGDLTQFGSREQFLTVKSLLGKLRIPCHVIPGNHDCKWSESGATEFSRIWGADRFVFDWAGLCFVGLHEGPVMKMGDGHFAPQDLRWLDQTLKKLPKQQPIIFVTHYPLDDTIDNWYLALDELKKFNTQAVLVGHGHHNERMTDEGVPSAMARSNLRGKSKIGGYTIVDVKDGVMSISERTPGVRTQPPWTTIKLETHDYSALTNNWPRPDFSIDKKYPGVDEHWHFDTGWTVASTPAIVGELAVVGDGSGTVRALRLDEGTVDWKFNAGGAVYSTPAICHDRVVFGSTDGKIYELSTINGKLIWEYATSRPVVASPLISNKIIYIGGSDGKFRALDLETGRKIWERGSIGGFVETRPVFWDGKIFFGAWDQHFYALDAKTGEILWKWMAKSPGDLGVMYSPAVEWPVVTDGKIFVVAPDRFMTALNPDTGHELWRTAVWQVRESIGLSEDRSRFYVRTMPGVIAAFSATADQPKELWETDAHTGLDINSAMPVEKDGVLFYGTKNDLLIAVDSKTGAMKWEHKMGVSVLNTVVPLNAREVLTADVDGRITLVEASATPERCDCD